MPSDAPLASVTLWIVFVRPPSTRSMPTIESPTMLSISSFETAISGKTRMPVLVVSSPRGLILVEVAGELELVLRRLRELAARALVDDALEQLGAELLVRAIAGLDQAEAERVERLVRQILLARELLRDRVALRGKPAELVEHGIVGPGRAQDALAGGLEREQREQEALLVVDRGVEVGVRPEQRLERAERLDRLALLSQPLRALEQQLDVLGRRNVGDELGDHALEHDLVAGRL